MIKVFTATPGSGKTLYCISLIDETLRDRKKDDESPDGLMPPRLVFTNIAGLNKDKFSEPASINIFDDPKEIGVDVFDWRDTPDGSLVIYDEAQFFFPNGKVKNERTQEILDAMNVHRHTGHDLIFITQAPGEINSKIRNLCGEHKHFYRGFNMPAATIYTWQHLTTNPNSRLEQTRSQEEIFQFPKQYYDWYESATEHTHKFYLPKKLKYLLTLICALLVFCYWAFFVDGGIKTFSSKDTDVSSNLISTDTKEQSQLNSTNVLTDVSKLNYAWSSTPAATSLMGCVSNLTAGLCQCFDINGDVISLEHAQCLSVVDNPIPRNIRGNNSNQ